MADAVERPRDRRRRADLRLDDDDVPGGDGAAPELVEQGLKRLPRIRAATAGRRHVPLAPERVRLLLDPELAEVAGHGGLGDRAAGGGQRLLQLPLGAEPAPLDQAQDEPLALTFARLALGVVLHTAGSMAQSAQAWKERAAAIRARAGKTLGDASDARRRARSTNGSGSVTIVPPRKGLFGAARAAAERAQRVIRLELELAALEVKKKTTSLVIGIGLALGAAFVALFGLLFAFATIAAALATFLSIWLSLLIVTAGLFALTGLLGLLAIRRFKKGSPPVPKAALREAKLTSEALKR